MNRPSLIGRCNITDASMFDPKHREICLNCAHRFWIYKHPILNIFKRVFYGVLGFLGVVSWFYAYVLWLVGI
jgi:hypothetical protein